MPTAVAEIMAQAIALHRQGALAQAAAQYAQALQHDPAHADALYALAQIACHEGRFAEGIDFARQVLAIDPQRARAHKLLGKALTGLPLFG